MFGTHMRNETSIIDLFENIMMLLVCFFPSAHVSATHVLRI